MQAWGAKAIFPRGPLLRGKRDMSSSQVFNDVVLEYDLNLGKHLTNSNLSCVRIIQEDRI